MDIEIRYLVRHFKVLSAVVDHEPIGIIRLALLLHYPYHQIRRSLHILKQYNLVEATPKGHIANNEGIGLIIQKWHFELCEIAELLREIRS